MKKTLINIYTTMLMHGLNQAEVCGAFGISDAKGSRILNGKTGLDNLDDDVAAAFFYDYPVIDAMFPVSQSATLENYTAEEAPIIARAMKIAAESATDPIDRWIFTRNAIRALFVGGAEYDGGRVLVNKARLEEAKKLCRSLPELACVSARLRPIIEKAAELNRLAADMLVEKSLDAIAAGSATIGGYELLLDTVHDELSAPQALAMNTDEKATMARKTILLYSATALAELYVESEQSTKVGSLMPKLLKVFGHDQVRLINSLIILSAWEHNQDALKDLLNQELKHAA